MKKTVTLGLLVAVVCIWGVLIFKVYSALKPNTSALPFVRHTFRHPTPSIKYQLSQYARDPFLSILTDTVTTIETPPPIKVAIPKKNITLPTYFGLIQSNNKRTAIVKLNKKIYFINEGDTIASVRLTKITADSVVAVAEGKKNTIYLDKKVKK